MTVFRASITNFKCVVYRFVFTGTVCLPADLSVTLSPRREGLTYLVWYYILCTSHSGWPLMPADKSQTANMYQKRTLHRHLFSALHVYLPVQFSQCPRDVAITVIPIAQMGRLRHRGFLLQPEVRQQGSDRAWAPSQAAGLQSTCS